MILNGAEDTQEDLQKGDGHVNTGWFGEESFVATG